MYDAAIVFHAMQLEEQAYPVEERMILIEIRTAHRHVIRVDGRANQQGAVDDAGIEKSRLPKMR